MHQLNHFFRVETTPNFNIAIHQSQATGCNCWSIMDCNSFLWTSRKLCSTPTPWGVFMPNKNINESKHPFACQDGLKKLRFGRLGWPILFWIVAEFIHQETCLLPFCLPKFEEIQQLLESPKVEVVQPFRSGEVGKNTTANAMINDYFVCAESPWKFNECTPFKAKTSWLLEKDGTCPTSSFQLWGCFWGGRGVRMGWNFVW